MNSEIKLHIDNIALKAKKLHAELIAEREKNQSLINEISQLKSLLSLNELKITELNSELVKAKTIVIEEKQVSQNAVQSGMSDSEIDHLVNEINYCIQQLKIAND